MLSKRGGQVTRTPSDLGSYVVIKISAPNGSLGVGLLENRAYKDPAHPDGGDAARYKAVGGGMGGCVDLAYSDYSGGGVEGMDDK